VEFAYLKIMHDGSDPVTGSTLVNPGVPIPADASKIHGITDSDVAGAPSLRELAPMISDLMRSCVVRASMCGNTMCRIFKKTWRALGQTCRIWMFLT